MERPIIKPIGSSLWDLDTPALFIDKDQIIGNWIAVKSFFLATGTKFRSNGSVFRTPAIYHMLEVTSVYVDTVSEGLVFASAGFEDITVGRIPVSDNGRLLESLISQSNLTICISSKKEFESLKNLIETSSNANEVNILIRISLEHAQMGVEMEDIDWEEVENLNSSDGFHKIGFIFRLPVESTQDENIAILDDLSRYFKQNDPCNNTIKHPVVAFASATTDPQISCHFITEIIEDSLILEASLNNQEGAIPVGVLSSVMSRPEPGLALIDCGQKAISTDRGVPGIAGMRDSYIEKMSAEHGFLILGPKRSSMNLGEKVVLSPSDIGDTFNLYDYVNVLSDEKLTAIWKVEARGKYV